MSAGAFAEAVVYPGGRTARFEAIQVVYPDTETPVPLFADLEGTTLANPVTTDELGNLFFCAEAGTYDLLVRNTRIRIGVVSGDGGGPEEVVTWPTGSEPPLAGVADGTLWIEYQP